MGYISKWNTRFFFVFEVYLNIFVMFFVNEGSGGDKILGEK